MSTAKAEFAIGELVHHTMFDYRGVVIDVDPYFHGSSEWYEQMARSRPPKDRPWYHVLVDGAVHRTYVAERNLEADETDDPIRHPELNDFFERLENGRYVPRQRGN